MRGSAPYVTEGQKLQRGGRGGRGGKTSLRHHYLVTLISSLPPHHSSHHFLKHQLPPYAELHCLTNFSFLRGASHPEELVERADALGYSALAITDECSVSGVVRAHVA